MTRYITTFILFVIISATLPLTTYAREEQAVTLVVNGQGNTADDAKQSALRNAIEQAFGTFISSKTDILNDELIKDEIVSVSNGNIQKFEVLSEGKLPDGSYYNTLKATVSVSKLTTFCESKGISVEFKGALFSFNIKQLLINEENEVKAIKDMSFMVKKIIDKSFDYKISASQPTAFHNAWNILIEIDVSVNKNFFQIPKIFKKTLSGLSLSKKGAEDYVNLKIPFYTVYMATPDDEDGQAYYLRNRCSIDTLREIINYFKFSIFNFYISNGIENYSLLQKRNSIRNSIIENNDIKFHPIQNGRSEYNFYSVDRYTFIDDLKFDPIAITRTYLRSIGDVKSVVRKFNFLYDLAEEDKDTFYPELHGIVMPRFKYIEISFLDIEENDFDLIKIQTNDVRTLEEINKITEYKIIPGSD